MLEISAGKKLCDARLARRLSIDEAAHATKMRPDKILALENDDFSRFGGAAYAKGFLLLYSRFLGVDVSSQLREFEGMDLRVNVEEYQYLSNAPEPAPQERAPIRRREGRPSVVPLVAVLLIAPLAFVVMYLVAEWRRLPVSQPKPGSAETTPPAVVAPAAPAHEGTESVNRQAAPAPAKPPERSSRPAEPASSLASAPGGAPSESPEVRRAEPARPPETPVLRIGAPTISQVEASGAANKLVVETSRKTWIKIRRDSPDGPVIYEDYVYPGAGHVAVKLHGARLFVEVRDQSAVQIRKDGQPIAYQPPGIWVQ